MIPITSEQQFKDTIGSTNQITVIYTGRESCGACVQFKPVYQMMAEYFVSIRTGFSPPDSILRFYTIDTALEFARNMLHSTIFPVFQVPTTLIYYGGRFVDSRVGFMPADEFKKFLNEVEEKIQSVTI